LHATSMTGLSPQQLDLLCDRIADLTGPWQPPRGRHRTLSLAAAVTMTLVWLRHNLSQALLGAFDDVSQPTVPRIITRLRGLIEQVTTQGIPVLAETAPTERLLVDGTLLPTGNRAGRQGQGLYSGKRHQGLGKVPECRFHGLVMPSSGRSRVASRAVRRRAAAMLRSPRACRMPMVRLRRLAMARGALPVRKPGGVLGEGGVTGCGAAPRCPSGRARSRRGGRGWPGRR
jgi:hypothetical protein